jgi:hypothetical protein
MGKSWQPKKKKKKKKKLAALPWPTPGGHSKGEINTIAASLPEDPHLNNERWLFSWPTFQMRKVRFRNAAQPSA